MKRVLFYGLCCVGLLLLGGCKKEEIQVEEEPSMTTSESSDFVEMGTDMGTTSTDMGTAMGTDMGEMPPEDTTDYHGKG